MASGAVWSPEELALLDAHYQRLTAAEMSALLAAHGYDRTPRACECVASIRRLTAVNRTPCSPKLQARLNALEALMLGAMRAARARGLELTARETVNAALSTAYYQPEILRAINERGRRSA